MNLFYLDHCVIFRRMVTRDTCFCFVNRFPINIIYLLTLGLCTTYYPMQTKRLSSTSLKGVKAAPSLDEKNNQNWSFYELRTSLSKKSLNLYSFKGLINMFKKRLSKTHSFLCGPYLQCKRHFSRTSCKAFWSRLHLFLLERDSGASKYVHIINLQMQKALNRVPFAGQSAQNIHYGFS